MSGNSVALDTSVAIAVLAGQAGTLLSQSREEILLPVPVIGELWYGALNSRRSAENLVEVERLVSRCRVLDIAAATAAVYARLRLRHQRALDRVTVDDAKRYLAEGHFGAGSMAPKIQAIIRFLESGGRRAIVTCPPDLEDAVAGNAGTAFVAS